MDIKIHEVKQIPIEELSVDGTNPNQMTINQTIVLKNNIEKFGFLVPIITNKDHVIADGEHRWNAARELKMETVPVIAIDVEEVDRRMIRQIMNKLRGEHDKEKDAIDYQWILESDDQAVSKFMQLLAQEEDEVLRVAQRVIKEEEAPTKVKFEVQHTCPECGFKF